MNENRVLVFTVCYNERANIGPMIDQVFAAVDDVDMLVVDDSSPDGTWDVITSYKSKYSRLRSVKRPSKRGVGSAHKYALYYAMREGYGKVVSLDADFAHDPKAIPKLLSESGPNIFVIGSRYCKGGSCEYIGYRSLVSRIGNFAARQMLDLPLQELTTYFRVFDVASLRKLPFQFIQSEGYSYGVQLIYYLHAVGVELREVPIHVSDRLHGKSKLPRNQIIISAVDLMCMSVSRILKWDRDFEPENRLQDECVLCGDRVLATKISRKDDGAPPVYTCLNCGHDQVPSSILCRDVERNFVKVEDQRPHLFQPALTRTFSHYMDKMERFLPPEPRVLLAIGLDYRLFIEEAKRREWRAEGIKARVLVSKYSHRTPSVSLSETASYSDRSAPDAKYNAIVAWDVIETLPDPIGFLRECREQLSDNGILFLLTLDTSHWLTKIFHAVSIGSRGAHIQYFKNDTIKTAFDRVGLDLLAAESCTSYVWAQDATKDNLSMFPRLSAALIRTLIQLFPEKLISKLTSGSVKMYVARKRLGPVVAPVEEC